MDQTLYTRTKNGVSDRRAILGYGQMLRELYFLDWSVLRVGWLMSFNGSANLPGTPRIALGGLSILSGAGGYSEGTATRNFLGVRTKASEWTYNSGPTAYFNAGQFEKVSKTGATVVSSAFSSPQTAYFSADPTVKNVLMVDLAKQSGFVTNISVYHPITSAAAQTDIDKDDFYELVVNNVQLTGYGATSTDAFTTAWSVTNSLTRPDALSLSWEKTAALMELSEVRIKSS